MINGLGVELELLQFVPTLDSDPHPMVLMPMLLLVFLLSHVQLM